MPLSVNANLKTCSLVNIIQKITVYETYHSFYIIGSNETEKSFKVVKIDRTSSQNNLSFSEDLHEYDEYEIKELISMVNIDSNIVPQATKQGKIMNPGVIRTHNAYAIIGFIRFLEGYYMILVTKQIPVAVLGYHVIYTIEDITMVYIPFIDKQTKEVNLDEQKYLKLFQQIDLRQNFYYSYTYDLTSTLQHNHTDINKISIDSDYKIYGTRNKPSKKFLWNEFLMKPVSEKLTYNWHINLIHGYLSQSSLNVFGCNVLVTLIGRRSQKYAGTRFLKRGGTNEGYVANEVETEQIVHNASVSSFEKGFYTSFVHTRGSIPLFWSQDPKAVPKPPINIDIVDPFATVASRHFKLLMHRFGAPLIILNLVKIREKKAQESIIANEYKLSLDYLKQFLPRQDFIEYICLDMSKLNKNPKANVMVKLYEIAESCVEKTGFFQNFNKFYANSGYIDKTNDDSDGHVRQNGVVRVNCVDCLDRTNTAMYVIGKCAMAHQLHALGIISSPKLGPDSICERMLIDLYEKMGDCIAQQYAGSQLVHRVDTYGKNTLASQSRDMMHTISRYYSNAFADADKQSAINIFLGVYEPSLHMKVNIWDMTTDCYLHDSFIMQPWKLPKNYIDWIDSKLFKCLPKPYDQENKSLLSFNHVEKIKDKNDPRISAYDNFYKPFELTAFHEVFYFNNLVVNRVNNNTVTSYSGIKAILDPFLAIRSTKKQISNSDSKYSSSLKLSNSTAEEDSDDSFEIIQEAPSLKTSNDKIRENETMDNNFLKFTLSDATIDLYKKYANISAEFSNSNRTAIRKNASWNNFSEYSIISSHSRKSSTGGFLTDKDFIASDFFKIRFEDQNVDPASLLKPQTKNFYEKFIRIGKEGAEEPTEDTISLYDSYSRELAFSRSV